MKILFLGPRTFPPKIGGIEAHVFEIAKRIAKKGHNVHVVVASDCEKPPTKIKRVTVHYIKTVNHPFFQKNILALKSLSLARKLNPDIIHAHDATNGFFHTLFSKKPVIYTSHGIGFKRTDWVFYVKAFLYLYENTAVRIAQRVIAVDRKTFDYWSQKQHNVSLIGNGVDIEKFKKHHPRPNKIDCKKITVFTIGRLIPSKGAQVLIEAFNLLSQKKQANAKLIIAGGGPQKQELIDASKKNDNIIFLGFIGDPTPYFIYSNIFVLPSFYEGLPISLLEGLGSENACISTDIADLKDRFNDVALFVEPGNANQLSMALEDLIDNKEKRVELAKKGVKKVKNLYSWDKIADETLQLYKDVTQNKF